MSSWNPSPPPPARPRRICPERQRREPGVPSARVEPGNVPLNPCNHESAHCIQETTDDPAGPPDENILPDSEHCVDRAYKHEPAAESETGKPRPGQRVRFPVLADMADCRDHIRSFRDEKEDETGPEKNGDE